MVGARCHGGHATPVPRESVRESTYNQVYYLTTAAMHALHEPRNGLAMILEKPSPKMSSEVSASDAENCDTRIQHFKGISAA